MNLSMLLDMAAGGFGDRLVVGRRDAGHSAEDLRQAAIGGARMLRERRAQALVYMDVNGPCFPAALFAAARAGVPLVPLNYRLSTEQLEVLLLKHEGAVVIAEDRFRPLLAQLELTAFSALEWLSAATELAPSGGDAVADDV